MGGYSRTKKKRFETTCIEVQIRTALIYSLLKLKNVVKNEFISVQAREELITGCILFFRPFNWGVGFITVRGLRSGSLRSAKPTRLLKHQVIFLYFAALIRSVI